jgi:hypothetical protein
MIEIVNKKLVFHIKTNGDRRFEVVLHSVNGIRVLFLNKLYLASSIGKAKKWIKKFSKKTFNQKAQILENKEISIFNSESDEVIPISFFELNKKK